MHAYRCVAVDPNGVDIVIVMRCENDRAICRSADDYGCERGTHANDHAPIYESTTGTTDFDQYN